MFTLSIELAFTLAAILADEDEFNGGIEKEIKIRFLGLRDLKGVIGGKPYPIFWIDTMIGDGFVISEDKIVETPDPPGYIEIRKYCKKFIELNSKYLFVPFIRGCNHKNFKRFPENYVSVINHLSEGWKRETERFESDRIVLSDEGVAPEAGPGAGPENDATQEELSRLEEELGKRKEAK